MTRILILQQRYNLADDAIEYQRLDRRSFLQFLGITQSSTLPDATTIWLFRDRLAPAGLGSKLFDRVQQQLLTHGYLGPCGQIIDASVVQSPVQRNKREEEKTETVTESTMPIIWKPHTHARKDVDATWTAKDGKNHFGYKLQASIKKRHKLVRKVILTNAAVSDSVVFEDLLGPNGCGVGLGGGGIRGGNRGEDQVW